MPIRVRRSVLCFVIALAMAFGSLLPHVPNSPSHDPIVVAAADAERHAQVQTEIAEHGHSHDHDEGHERVSGHSHGHNPADHSHETPTTPPAMFAVEPSLVRSWVPALSEPAHVNTNDRLERPPQAIVIA